MVACERSLFVGTDGKGREAGYVCFQWKREVNCGWGLLFYANEQVMKFN